MHLRATRACPLCVLIALGCLWSTATADDTGIDKTSFILPWGPRPWPDKINIPLRPKGPLEGQSVTFSPTGAPSGVNCTKFKYGFTHSFVDDSKVLFESGTTISLSPGCELDRGVKLAFFGQVYEVREVMPRVAMLLDNHPQAVPVEESAGLFSVQGEFSVSAVKTVRGENVVSCGGIRLRRAREYVNSKVVSGIHTYDGIRDLFPKLEIKNVAGADLQNEVLSPFKIPPKMPREPSDHEEGWHPELYSPKVDDIIETTYFKFKVHSIVMPDEEELISGWINIKLIESKPVTK